jgi:hypothetical protein
MTSLDRRARPPAHNCLLASRLRCGRLLLLTALVALALVFATTSRPASAASPPTSQTTTFPGYDQASIDRALAAVNRLTVALHKKLHPQRKHQHRHP